MADVIQYGPTAWQKRCERCDSRFRYELKDIEEDRFFGIQYGMSVPCPVCGYRCRLETDRFNRMPDEASGGAPTYYELLDELRWFVGTAENAAEMIDEDGIDDDDEETDEVRERVVEAKQMILRADKRLGYNQPRGSR